ncbi:MAG: VanZ family protein [Oscillospiraceae bacterium]|nr:VanZ family protein [Oscillospiraceae bacterium]
MEIINAILYQFRVIGLTWWIIIGAVTALLLIFRHKREQMIGNLLIVYLLLILASTVLARSPVRHNTLSELINIDLIGTWARRFTEDIYSRSELLLNFCMLLPVGVLFPWATKKGFGITVLFGFALIVLIELAQLITGRGWFELTDIADNTVGVMIGYGLFRIGEFLWRKAKC